MVKEVIKIIKIGVIGAGPAGILAAGMASNKNTEVALIDKNKKIGKKLYITGKGRCNVTNSIPIDEFFDFIVTNKPFLYSSLYTFTNENLVDFISKYGTATKIERGNRVFPVSNKSSDIISSLNKFLIDKDVNIMLNTNIVSINKIENVFKVSTKDKVLEFDKVVLATGGISYPLTGSTGDGYKFAKECGHTIVETKASLVPIEISENFLKELQGLSLKNVTLKSFNGKKLIYEEFGEMIFTHFGISGPIVLTSSSYITRENKKNLNFEIDLKPALDYKQLDDRIIRDFELYSNKQFKNSLNDLLPQKIIPIIINRSNIKGDKIVHQIRKDERENLVNTIKKFSLKFKKMRSIEEAIITSGGISIKEINPSTMESLIIDGLYFAGEIIDVDALTGGFNLQIAFSTGYLAGTSIFKD